MIWAIIIFFSVAIDQIFKFIILRNLEVGESIKVIDGFFNITHVKNTGAAWGILKDARWFFVVITIVLIFFLLYLIKKEKHPLMRTAISLIMGGALGNFIDRVLFGKVTDFLDFNIFGYKYPVFNFADIFVVVGAVILAVYILFFVKEKRDE